MSLIANIVVNAVALQYPQQLASLGADLILNWSSYFIYLNGTVFLKAQSAEKR